MSHGPGYTPRAIPMPARTHHRKTGLYCYKRCSHQVLGASGTPHRGPSAHPCRVPAVVRLPLRVLPRGTSSAKLDPGGLSRRASIYIQAHVRSEIGTCPLPKSTILVGCERMGFPIHPALETDKLPQFQVFFGLRRSKRLGTGLIHSEPLSLQRRVRAPAKNPTRPR